jgi:hypothetical protein
VSIDGLQPSDLVDGIFFKAMIPGKNLSGAVRIPRKSLYNETYVYLIQQGNLDLRKVGVARKEARSVIINDGISSGDTLVVELLQGVAPGMPAMAKRDVMEGSE